MKITIESSSPITGDRKISMEVPEGMTIEDIFIEVITPLLFAYGYSYQNIKDILGDLDM